MCQPKTGPSARVFSLGRIYPYFFLLAEVLLFYRTVLFQREWTFPWDFRSYSFPNAFLSVQALRAGEWALWNPYIYCGHPIAANVQAATLYPPRVLTVLAASIAGSEHLLGLMQWELVLHVYAAAVFTYWCGRQWGLSRDAGLIAATVFALGGYFASQAEHIGAIETATWLPLIVGSLASWQRAPLRSVLVMSGAWSMALLAGFTPLLFDLYLAIAAFGILLVLFRLAAWRVLLTIAGALAFSWLLSAIAMLPAIQLTGLSVGQFRTDWRGTGGGLPAFSLITLLWPNSFHILEPGNYSGHEQITFMYVYCGLVGLALATIACAQVPDKRRWVFLLLFLISGIAMLGDSTPVGKAFFVSLPAQIRGPLYPHHWLAVFVFALAILSGFGLHQLRERPRLAVGIVIAAALELIAVSSSRPFNIESLVAEPGITPRAFDGSEELMARARQVVSAAFPPERIDTYRDSIGWVESAPVTGIPTAGGEDPLALVRFMQVRLSFCSGARWGAYYEVDNPAFHVLDFLNVRCLVSRTPIPKELLDASGIDNLGVVPGHMLYKNPRALSRFFLAPHALPVSSAADALVYIRRSTWRPDSEAAVEAPPGVLPAPGGRGSVRVLAYRMNSVDLSVDSTAPALLASSEVNYPGWRAFIDGHESTIYVCNGAFRSVIVPAGQHLVHFRFMPPAFVAGGIVSIGSWVVWALLWKRRGLPSSLT
jgi:hypothetical protein